MKNGNFARSVVGESEDTATGTVTLPHQQTFRIELTNHLPRRRCNVRLSFNGRDAGEYRIAAGQTISLKRPAEQGAPFTFLQPGTAEAKAAGLALDGTAGFIRARFLPEASSEQRLAMDFSPESLDPLVSKEDAAEIAAAFGLTDGDPTTVYAVGKDGTFQEADDIFTFDDFASVEIEARLQGQIGVSLNVDAHDRLSNEVARLEQDIEKACSDFDYEKALKLGKELRVMERELLRTEWQAEIGELRRQVKSLRAATTR